MGIPAERTADALKRKSTFKDIVRHVSCGGTLKGYCNNLNIRYSDVIWWIQEHPQRLEAYRNAVSLRDEWVKESLVGNLAEVAQFDMGDIVDSDGQVKPINEWSDHARRTIQSLTIDGDRTTVRMPERLKAYELVGKAFGIWKDKVDVNAEVSFADIVTEAAKRATSDESE